MGKSKLEQIGGRDGERASNGIPVISWGVDGFGRKHYLCDYCELYFGLVDPDTIVHMCDTSKPRYHNRGIVNETAFSAFIRSPEEEKRAVYLSVIEKSIERQRKTLENQH